MSLRLRTTVRRAPVGLAVLAFAALAGACGDGRQTAPSSTQPSTSEPSTTQPSTSMPSTTRPSTTRPSTSEPSSTTAPATTTAPSTLRPVHVYFLDSEHARIGTEPLFVPVRRDVHPPALAAGALDALFAGPTAAEKDEGLRLVLSGATGYRHLHIEGGIARVSLEGGCSSGGSTMTIAGELMPTLRQFATVDYVKIYAPDGTTERPSGPSDSIPTCLEL